MQQPISRQVHGAVDWAYVPTVAALPAATGFDRDTVPARLARGIAAAALVSTVFTRFEAGVVRVIPFRVHLGIDAAISLFALAAPWLFDFADDVRARNAFVAVGAAGLTVGALTRPEEMPRDG